MNKTSCVIHRFWYHQTYLFCHICVNVGKPAQVCDFFSHCLHMCVNVHDTVDCLMTETFQRPEPSQAFLRPQEKCGLCELIPWMNYRTDGWAYAYLPMSESEGLWITAASGDVMLACHQPNVWRNIAELKRNSKINLI